MVILIYSHGLEFSHKAVYRIQSFIPAVGTENLFLFLLNEFNFFAKNF